MNPSSNPTKNIFYSSDNTVTSKPRLITVNQPPATAETLLCQVNQLNSISLSDEYYYVDIHQNGTCDITYRNPEGAVMFKCPTIQYAIDMISSEIILIIKRCHRLTERLYAVQKEVAKPSGRL